MRKASLNSDRKRSLILISFKIYTELNGVGNRSNYASDGERGGDFGRIFEASKRNIIGMLHR